MHSSKYRCLVCNQSDLRPSASSWQCQVCGKNYGTIHGIPRLYLESDIGAQDRVLRDFFYNGFLGRYYQHVMPFLALPVRPGYWKGWFAYGLIVSALVALISYCAVIGVSTSGFSFSGFDVCALLLLFGTGYFLLRHRYLFYLLVLAIPVKISLSLTRFKPVESFAAIHAKHIETLLKGRNALQVLDVSTGSCNSLYRHGWMELHADYTGLDLSETMLLRGLRFMRENQIPIDLVLGNATHLPFASETFDVVLNYGALNGYADSKRALDEMARVAKTGGLVFFLDEQLYESASLIEGIYFRRVLSSHNVFHRCPVELIPASLGDIQVRQVYPFYYICTCVKR